MWPDRVSNPGPLTYESDALPTSGLKFQPGTRQASSLVEIPTPRVRFPYPTWTLMMDCYILLFRVDSD